MCCLQHVGSANRKVMCGIKKGQLGQEPILCKDLILVMQPLDIPARIAPQWCRNEASNEMKAL